MYEPSKELIEQIAKEVWADMKSKAEKPYYPLNLAKPEIIDKFMDFTKDICSYQTIRKALELYENQPKWQDKPDKEGWWWVFSLYVRGNPLIFPLYPIHILFCDGELHADTSYPEKFPSIPDYIKTLSNPMWLYIPEPHITNPTPDGGNL